MPLRLAALFAAALSLAALAACNTPVTPDGTTAPRTGAAQAGTTAAEAEMRRQQAALRRTLVEGVATGIAGTTLIAGLFQDDGDAFGTGIRIGAPSGLAAGTYVAALQRRYATREARLAKLREDIQATNARAEAAIAAMRVVVAQQTKELAAARAEGGAATAKETAEAQANLGTMRGLIAAAEARREEVLSTRKLQLAPGQETGVDAEVEALGRRIATMREIAEILASEV